MNKTKPENNSSIPDLNTKAVTSFRTSIKTEESFITITYKKGDEVVNTGVIVDVGLKPLKDFSYAKVPLGFIVKGEVTVVKGAKGTKRLGVGDFIGLFETSDWLLTQQTRHIGDWTLIANDATEIIYFPLHALEVKNKAGEIFREYITNLARMDRVPQPLTDQPLLDWVASHTTTSRLPDTIIVAHTHLLPNNLPFFRHLAHLVGFGKIFVLEKPYSTVRETYNELVQSGVEVVSVKLEQGMPYDFSVQRSLDVIWRKVIEECRTSHAKNIIIVDDGGDLWHSIPWEGLKGIAIAGVEQTQRGITRIQDTTFRLPPIVSVATSGIKKLVEAGFIGHSVVQKLQDNDILTSAEKVGVLGMGAIGESIVASLAAVGKEALFYDASFHKRASDSKNARNSIDSLLKDTDVIIGTTGTDSFKGVALERVTGMKTLVSASSADVEFTSLIKLAPPQNSLGTIKVNVHNNLTLQILNGGYPYNFDRSGNATPDEDITLTRSLLYIGVMQAAYLLHTGLQTPAIYNLDSISQINTLKQWMLNKARGKILPATIDTDIKNIVTTNFLKDGKDMETIWKE